MSELKIRLNTFIKRIRTHRDSKKIRDVLRGEDADRLLRLELHFPRRSFNREGDPPQAPYSTRAPVNLPERITPNKLRGPQLCCLNPAREPRRLSNRGDGPDLRDPRSLVLCGTLREAPPEVRGAMCGSIQPYEGSSREEISLAYLKPCAVTPPV